MFSSIQIIYAIQYSSQMSGLVLAVVIITVVLIIGVVASISIALAPAPDKPAAGSGGDTTTSTGFVVTSALWYQEDNPSNSEDVTTLVQSVLNTTTGLLSVSGGFTTHAQEIAKGKTKTLLVSYTKDGKTMTPYMWTENVTGPTNSSTIQLP